MAGTGGVRYLISKFVDRQKKTSKNLPALNVIKDITWTLMGLVFYHSSSNISVATIEIALWAGIGGRGRWSSPLFFNLLGPTLEVSEQLGSF